MNGINLQACACQCKRKDRADHPHLFACARCRPGSSPFHLLQLIILLSLISLTLLDDLFPGRKWSTICCTHRGRCCTLYDAAVVIVLPRREGKFKTLLLMDNVCELAGREVGLGNSEDGTGVSDRRQKGSGRLLGVKDVSLIFKVEKTSINM